MRRDLAHVRRVAAQHALQGHTALADMLADLADEVEALRPAVPLLEEVSRDAWGAVRPGGQVAPVYRHVDEFLEAVR